MSYILSENRIRKSYTATTPGGLYEANYRRLNRLFLNLKSFKLNKTINLPIPKLSVRIAEQYKYTSVVILNQLLTEHPINSFVVDCRDLSVINMELRVCHDACLLEVIAYQGKSSIYTTMTYPNKHMLQIDEKKQLNLLLKDILESALKSVHSRNCAVTIL